MATIGGYLLETPLKRPNRSRRTDLNEAAEVYHGRAPVPEERWTNTQGERGKARGPRLIQARLLLEEDAQIVIKQAEESTILR
jgi:hypothetical protein